MTSSTYTHISLFYKAEPKRQLDLLSDFVIESGNIVITDVNGFNNRLDMYADKAGVSIEQARENVFIEVLKKTAKRLYSFGIMKAYQISEILEDGNEEKKAS